MIIEGLEETIQGLNLPFLFNNTSSISHLAVILSSTVVPAAVEDARGWRIRRFVRGWRRMGRSRSGSAAAMRRRISGGRRQRRRFRRPRTPLAAPLSSIGGAIDGVNAAAAASAADVKAAGNVGGEKGLIFAGRPTHLLKGEEMRPKSRFALFRL